MALQINSKYKAKAVSYNSASVKSAKIDTLTTSKKVKVLSEKGN